MFILCDKCALFRLILIILSEHCNWSAYECMKNLIILQFFETKNYHECVTSQCVIIIKYEKNVNYKNYCTIT